MAVLASFGFKETTSDDWVTVGMMIMYSYIILSLTQDLLWTMFPQWNYIGQQSITVPHHWQVHNHCFSLQDNQGISGTKISQWEHYKCMLDRHGPDAFWYMPETIVLQRLAFNTLMS